MLFKVRGTDKIHPFGQNLRYSKIRDQLEGKEAEESVERGIKTNTPPIATT
jgi:hypothetical protein